LTKLHQEVAKANESTTRTDLYKKCVH